MSDNKHQFSELSSTLTKKKACIDAISRKPQGTNSNEDNKGQEAPVSGDAGNAFGGRTSKSTKTWIASILSLALIGLMMFINFYLLTRLGVHKPTIVNIKDTSHIKKIVPSVGRKKGPTRILLAACSVLNSANEYNGRI